MLKRMNPVFRRVVAVSLAALASSVVLVGCSAQLGDRGGEEGSPPDVIGDVDYIEVWRNADDFPNVARVCVEGVAFATTSSPRGDSAGGAPLIRVGEWDSFCAAKVSAAVG